MKNNNEFFNEAFNGYTVPVNIRKASEDICKRFNINGICDPMYISNVIAYELNLGDGCSNFNNNVPTLENVDKLSKRLIGSYGCNINDSETVKEIVCSHI